MNSEDSGLATFMVVVTRGRGETAGCQSPTRSRIAEDSGRTGRLFFGGYGCRERSPSAEAGHARKDRAIT